MDVRRANPDQKFVVSGEDDAVDGEEFLVDLVADFGWEREERCSSFVAEPWRSQTVTSCSRQTGLWL